MADLSFEDLEGDGFEIDQGEPIESKKEKKKEIKKEPEKVYMPAPTIIVDNKELVNAVNNIDLIKAINISNQAIQKTMRDLTDSMKEKPESITLNIKRDERNFMKTIVVTFNK
jgi:hypothetical protein